MADKNALGMIGLMLGAATMFVVCVGTVLVTGYGSGGLAQDGTTQVAARVMTVSAKMQ